MRPNTYAGQIFHIRPTYIVSIPDSTLPPTPRARDIPGEQQCEECKQKFEVLHKFTSKLSNSSAMVCKRCRQILNLKYNQPEGQISAKAATRIRNSIAWMYAAARRKRVYSKATGKGYYFKLNFITLTLSAEQGELTDHHFKSKMLRSFLNMCMYRKGLKNYFWRVEPQENGNIHAHIITDTFLHWKDVRNYWNKVQAKHGFIDKFEKKHSHRNPNSTDIKAIKNDRDLAAYMADYVGKKQEGRRAIQGKLWATNSAISNANKCQLYAEPAQVSNFVRCLDNPAIQYKKIETPPDAFGKTEQIGELYLLTPSLWENVVNSRLKEEYDNHRFHIRHGLEKIPLTYYTN